MDNKIFMNLHDFLLCVSNAQDLVSLTLKNHQQQVAYLAFRLAEQLDFSLEQQHDILHAALIHDVGVLSTKEKLELVEQEVSNVNSHAFKGAKLLEGFRPMKNCVEFVRYHHIAWDHGNGRYYNGQTVPLESHVIHLADAVCLLINKDSHILTQIPIILSKIQEETNSEFAPEMVKKLMEISNREYIWLDLLSQSPIEKISNANSFSALVLDIDDLIDLALVFARIIDFRSKFTARHSVGVAKTAEMLARLVGFSNYECKMMLVAGYLHDLGKIAISDAVLEKPQKLNEDEFNIMRSHTYYTYHSLKPLTQLETINTWASFHHEKLDGTGYPFHIGSDGLSLGSRIMAVADVFTAISEDRPYRDGMDYPTTKNVLINMVKSNALDENIVNILLNNYYEINNVRIQSQIEAATQYEEFLHS